MTLFRSDNPAVLLMSGNIFIKDAPNITFSSRSGNSIAAGLPRQLGNIVISNSKVTSRVGWESDNEFLASQVFLENATLDMSYGTINPTVAGHCTWLGKIRSAAQVSRSEEHTSELQSLRHLVCR